jgi:NAD(P)-dependent dehydrogenase (short-subunit alcohol dehydrogenase family)
MSFRPLDSLNGRVAIITGVVGGIGYATAQRLAARGAKIIGVTRRDLEHTQQRLSELPNPGLGHLAVLADVTDSDQMSQAYKQIECLGRCDILVNAVGETKRIPQERLELLTDHIFDTVVKDNLRSYYSSIRTFYPLMKNTAESVIVNIGSVSAQSGNGSNMAYAASKAGIDSLTRSLSQTIAPVRVVTVSPGVVNTGFVPGLPENFADEVAKWTPLKRIATVEDVAAAVEAVVTLLRFTTGVVINVDGGRRV